MKSLKRLSKKQLIIICSISILVIGLSYAFFTLIVTNSDVLNVGVTSSDISTLYFTEGEDLYIDAYMSTFQMDGDNFSSSSTSYATLEGSVSYTDYYHVYFGIETNEFVYTSDVAELILVVEGPNGVVEEIDGLDYVTVNEVSGFDVTDKEGVFEISYEEISSSGSTVIEDWTFTLYFVNLDTNQADNANKEFNSYIVLTQDEWEYIAYFNEHVTSLVGTVQGTGEVVDENGYRYEGVNPNNYVWFNDELWRIIGVFDTEVVNDEGGYSTESLVKIVRAESIGSYSRDNSYTGDGLTYSNNWPTSDLYYLLNGAYYYAEDGTNSSDNEYNYCWNGTYSTSWGSCDFTEIGISEEYRSLAENVVWYLGGRNGSYYISYIYNSERSASAIYSGSAATAEAFIGLIYVTDYLYATLTDYCDRTTTSGSYSTTGCYNQDWLYTGYVYWTLMPNFAYSYRVWYVSSSGSTGDISSNLAYHVIPVLYLSSNTLISSGDGAEGDPYILVL